MIPEQVRDLHKLEDLVDLAEKYEIFSMKRELTSDETLVITKDNVIFTAQVAKNYQKQQGKGSNLKKHILVVSRLQRLLWKHRKSEGS